MIRRGATKAVRGELEVGSPRCEVTSRNVRLQTENFCSARTGAIETAVFLIDGGSCRPMIGGFGKAAGPGSHDLMVEAGNGWFRARGDDFADSQ